MISAQEFSEGRIILIDKPLHWSSFQAVNKIKWAIIKHYKVKKIKIGHAGTLDPLASGLLVLCTGKYTKKITEIQDATKTYTGTITLGATTPSYDMETEVDTHYPTAHITPEMIEQVRQQFTGELLQTPPVFSAIKKEGKRLYEFAREGEVVEVPQRTIYIHNFEIDATNFPELHFEVTCSKGTYIRSLANDFGKALGTGGYLSALRRTRIGDYKVEDALSPDAFVEAYIPDLRGGNVKPLEAKEVTPSFKKKKKNNWLEREWQQFTGMFSRGDKAIMLTLLILFGTVITLMATQLQHKPKEILIEMVQLPDDVPLPPTPIDELPTSPTPNTLSSNNLTTNAYNQANPQLRHSTDEIKTLDELLNERMATEMATAKDELLSSDRTTTDFVVNEKTTADIKVRETDKVNKNTLVKYSLQGRKGVIPNPVFTCEAEGQVVVIITVNDNGRVTKTSIDRQQSTTDNDCLIDNSLRYAQQAKFNVDIQKKEQIGSITYIFQRKR